MELLAVICIQPKVTQMCLLLVASLDLVQATQWRGSRPIACCLDWSESEPARCLWTHQINVRPTRRLPNSRFEFRTAIQRLIPDCWSDGNQTQPNSWMSLTFLFSTCMSCTYIALPMQTVDPRSETPTLRHSHLSERDGVTATNRKLLLASQQLAYSGWLHPHFFPSSACIGQKKHWLK